MDNQAIPSPNERYCSVQFERWMRTCEPEADISWRYVPRNEQADKPDFYLTIDGITYAVEVSTITKRVQVDGKVLEEVGVIDAL